MNISYINLLRTLAILLLCVVASSCSQDDLDAEHGETLPTGKYPLLFTASIDEMTSRAAQSDPWYDGDEIAVQIEDYSATGRYSLNVDGTVKDSKNPMAWPFENGQVKAWYPFVNSDNKIERSITDQSAGYHDIDFLYAATENKMNYKQTVDLRFRHQMAKVSCRFIKGEGVTDDDLKTAKVSYHGCTTASFKAGQVTGSGDGWIKADTAHVALLVPQKMEAGDFIKTDITLTLNGNEVHKTLTYSTPGLELKAGTHYVYNITVRKDSLSVESITADWKDQGEQQPAESAEFIVHMPDSLPADCRDSFIFTENVTNRNDFKNGTADSLIVKGNEFKISFLAESESLVNLYIIEGSEVDKSIDTVVQPTGDKDPGEYYEISFRLRSREVTLRCEELFIYPKVGDFYYDDGTWSRKLKDDKTCIGIVVKTGAGEKDADNDKILKSEILGYVMSLKEIESKWVEVAPQVNSTSINVSEEFDGYHSTLNMKTLLDDKGKPSIAGKLQNWGTTIPPSSTGWYVPSRAQLSEFFLLKNYNQYKDNLKKCGGDTIPMNGNTNGNVNFYWTSRMSSNTMIHVVFRLNGNMDNTKTRSYSIATGRLRPIMSFKTWKKETDE